MIKYDNAQVNFSDIPDKVCLSISITGCKNRCEGCHSPHLLEDIGNPLDGDSLRDLIYKHKGVDCVVFLGDAGSPEDMIRLSEVVRSEKLLTAIYSGGDEVPEAYFENFDYVKVGRYIRNLGGLSNPETNQRVYQMVDEKKIDITSRYHLTINA